MASDSKPELQSAQDKDYANEIGINTATLTTPRQLKSLCVFCGSSPGVDPAYTEQARVLGAEMAKRNITLVYGGGNIGVMGTVSKACEQAGGRVIGIIPDALKPREISGDVNDNREVITVPDMHTRKKMMAEKSEAFIALPGGFGTLEELFEVITWQQLGIHHKPIGILNVNGFYDSLLEFIKNTSKQGFIRENYLNIIVSSSEPIDLLNKLEVHIPPQGLTTWLKSSEV